MLFTSATIGQSRAARPCARTLRSVWHPCPSIGEPCRLHFVTWVSVFPYIPERMYAHCELDQREICVRLSRQPNNRHCSRSHLTRSAHRIGILYGSIPKCHTRCYMCFVLYPLTFNPDSRRIGQKIETTFIGQNCDSTPHKGIGSLDGRILLPARCRVYDFDCHEIILLSTLLGDWLLCGAKETATHTIWL